MDEINKLIKERFYLDVITKYNITDTGIAFRKEVDEQIIDDFYDLWNQCNDLIQKVSMLERDKNVKQ